MNDLVPSDIGVLDLLRKQNGMSVAEFQEALDVTATAVRQRLTRLMAQGYVRREAIESTGRGRPSHRYHLTPQGRRTSGANFGDLAVALWEEIRAIKNSEVRRGLLQRVSSRLAQVYANRVAGVHLTERMESLVELFRERQIPFEVQEDGRGLPVLTALACPYPDLAERDPSICAMERMLFSDLLGENVSLDRCRLDGHDCCTFRAAGTDSAVTASQETT
jgi:predicted ArsR family transcriptional regulator